MRPLLPLSAAVLAAAFVLSACGGSSSGTSQVTEITEAPTTATTDPYAVPAVIDTAYVDKILNAHAKSRDEAVHNVARTKTFSAEDEQRIRDIYAEPALSFQLGVFQRAATTSQLDSLQTVVSRAATREVRVATPSCIWAEADSTGTGATTLFGYVLHPGARTSNNDTGWVQVQATLPERLTVANAC